MDIYGKPVRLTFKGADTYKTQIGATVTILAGMAVITFGLYSWASRAERGRISQTTMHQDPFYEKYSDVLGCSDIGDDVVVPKKYFAFGLGSEPLDPSIG